MIKHHPIFIGLPLLLLPAQSFAAEQPVVMDEVVISASRVKESKKEVSANITVINSEDIAQSTSTNLADLLAEKGLGHVHAYPGSLASIGLRGFRTDTLGNDLRSHVLILIDGRRAGTGNAKKILNKNIDRIEIIRGPGAVQYGSAGMGGVINVITKQGTENSGFAEIGAGSFGRMEESVGATFAGAKIDFSAALSNTKIDDYDTGDGKTFYNTGIDRETGAGINIGYTFTANNRIGLVFNGYEADGAGTPNYLSANDLDDYTETSNYSFDLSYSGASSDNTASWLARYFFGKDENNWYDPTASNPDWYDDAVPDKNKTDQQGLQLQGSSAIGILTLTGGFDWTNYDVTNSWSPEKTTYSNPAVFLLGKVKLGSDNLVANFGLRQDWFDVEVEEPVGRKEDQDNLSPMLGLAWQATDTIKVRAQYAEAFMMPSADQLAIDTSSWGTRVVGNPNLDPEKSKTYEAGIDYQKNSLKLALSYFRSSYEDKIITDYLADGSRSWTNLGDATIAGIETEVGYDLGEPLGLEWELRPYLNLTYFDGLRR